MNNVYILTSAQNVFKYDCKTPCDPIVKPSLMIQYNVSLMRWSNKCKLDLFTMLCVTEHPGIASIILLSSQEGCTPTWKRRHI